MSPEFSCRLFDLDGTLIDSIELIERSYEHTLREHTGSAPDRTFWLQGLGRPLKWQFGQITTDADEIEAMIRTYRRFNDEHHDALVQAYPGVRAALERLAEQGVRLGVVTSKLRAGARRGLEHCGLAEFFEIIVGADDVERPKPDPEPVKLALTRAGASAGETIFIGDSPHDLTAGRDAGVATGAALWGPFPRVELEASAPDYWLSQPSDFA